jgi:hypothetical protein
LHDGAWLALVPSAQDVSPTLDIFDVRTGTRVRHVEIEPGDSWALGTGELGEAPRLARLHAPRASCPRLSVTDLEDEAIRAKPIPLAECPLSISWIDKSPFLVIATSGGGLLLDVRSGRAVRPPGAQVLAGQRLGSILYYAHEPRDAGLLEAFDLVSGRRWVAARSLGAIRSVTTEPISGRVLVENGNDAIFAYEPGSPAGKIFTCRPPG